MHKESKIRVVICQSRLLRPDPNYLNEQADIEEEVRAIVVIWMIHVCKLSSCKHEIPFLATNLLDRYLSQVIVNKKLMQLVAAACILIASKWEEKPYLSGDKLMEFAARSFTKDELKKTEVLVLVELNFRILICSPLRVMESVCDEYSLGEFEMEHSKHICRVALSEYKVLAFNRDEVAIAALFLSLELRKKSTECLRHLCADVGIEQMKLEECIQVLRQLEQ